VLKQHAVNLESPLEIHRSHEPHEPNAAVSTKDSDIPLTGLKASIGSHYSVLCLSSCHNFSHMTKHQQHPSNSLFFQDNLCKLDFIEAKDHGMAVASTGPYANLLHFAADR